MILVLVIVKSSVGKLYEHSAFQVQAGVSLFFYIVKVLGPLHVNKVISSSFLIY